MIESDRLAMAMKRMGEFAKWKALVLVEYTAGPGEMPVNVICGRKKKDSKIELEPLALLLDDKDKAMLCEPCTNGGGWIEYINLSGEVSISHKPVDALAIEDCTAADAI